DIAERFQNEIDIKWGDTVNMSSLNKNLIKQFSKSGCIEINTGIVTASPKLHKYTNRNPKQEFLKHYSHNLKQLDYYGIWTLTNIISGLPYENKEDVKKTTEFLISQKKYINGIFNDKFILLPNSPFWKYPEKYGLKVLGPEVEFNRISSRRHTLRMGHWSYKFQELHRKNSNRIGIQKYYDHLLEKLFPKNVNMWYQIFLLYNNFDTKKDIIKFLHN
ncbi:MAG: hypothetical protein ACQESF_06885, partial [Nanobdellota archaeon]